MTETSEKVHKELYRPTFFEHCVPQGYGSSTTRPSTVGRLLKCGAIVLIVGAVLILCASIGAFYQWKVNDKNVHNLHYSMKINGELREGSLEIGSDNNPEMFPTGSGEEETVEIHDFQIGITGIRFFHGEKCYIKPHIKSALPDMETYRRGLSFDLSDETIPVRFEEDSVIWLAADHPMKETRFLSSKILALCGDSPIYWLHPTYPKVPIPPVAAGADGERRRRDTQRAKRQFNTGELEAAAELGDMVSHPEDAKEEDGGQSAAGSAYNPENPYHRTGTEAGEEGAVTFDPMLDHLGICCSECRRSYTHCQRVCEPLRGHWPWPYNYRGCQVVCRVILPCRWWVARILGVV